MIGNGKEITAVGEGNIRIPTALGSIFRTKVLHVPDIGSNLISVATIVDQGFRVEFTKTQCAVSKEQTLQAMGKRNGNIYYLTGLQEIGLAGIARMGDQTSQENLASKDWPPEFKSTVDYKDQAVSNRI